MEHIISIDPGHYKCGIIIANIDKREVVQGKIVKSFAVIDLILKWNNSYNISLVLLGNGTSSNFWHNQLLINKVSQISFVEERNSTIRAKDRYFELWPPSFFLNLIPRGLLLPPTNLDSIAALILMEDFLQQKLSWEFKPSFTPWPES